MDENNAVFNTAPGVTVARELLISYLNTGTKTSPVWSKVGKRVEDSSMEMDWGIESKKDIFGDTYSTGQKSTRTQTFEPCELDSGDAAQQRIWDLAVRKDDVNALMNMDMLIAHFYVGDEGKNFAERYESCSVLPSSLGGAGGGSVGMPIDVTYGGTRTLGTVSRDSSGVVTFTPDSASGQSN